MNLLLIVTLACSSDALRLQKTRHDSAKLPDDDEVAALSRHMTGHDGIPKQGNIAVIVRGQAFRSGPHETGCNSSLLSTQLAATDSLMLNIVKPLESNGNKVRLFVVNGNSDCGDFEQVLTKFGKRVQALSIFDSKNQAENMRQALEQFKDKACEECVENKATSLESLLKAGGKTDERYDYISGAYDLIMIARHDVHWHTPIFNWPKLSFKKFKMFNFFSRCEYLKDSEWCVNDMFHMMPGKLFKDWDTLVGTHNCFNGEHWMSSGHGCWAPLYQKLHKTQISFITEWRPHVNVREDSNGIAKIISFEKDLDEVYPDSIASPIFKDDEMA